MDNHWWHLEQTVDGARRRCGVTRCRTSWLVIFCSAKAIIVILRAVFWCYYYYYFNNTTPHGCFSVVWGVGLCCWSLHELLLFFCNCNNK